MEVDRNFQPHRSSNDASTQTYVEIGCTVT